MQRLKGMSIHVASEGQLLFPAISGILSHRASVLCL